jgi:hypothetical protein
VAGRLKIKIRPMITITATMMMIQVLRFMGCPFQDSWTLQSAGMWVLRSKSPVIGGIQFGRSLGGVVSLVVGRGGE